MSFKIAYNDLITLIKAYGYDEHTAIVVADYLDECIGYELDLTHYLWNTLPFNVHVFKTKEEAQNYIENESLSSENYTLYECSNYHGIYLEVY